VLIGLRQAAERLVVAVEAAAMEDVEVSALPREAVGVVREVIRPT
jgi:hypothetical protein